MQSRDRRDDREFGFFALSVLTGIDAVDITYPVIQVPEKITSFNFDKQPEVEGVLLGVKGQYLIFGDGTVFNVRSNEGYVVRITVN